MQEGKYFFRVDMVLFVGVEDPVSVGAYLIGDDCEEFNRLQQCWREKAIRMFESCEVEMRYDIVIRDCKIEYLEEMPDLSDLEDLRSSETSILDEITKQMIAREIRSDEAEPEVPIPPGLAELDSEMENFLKTGR
jgi:hypothetical protein